MSRLALLRKAAERDYKRQQREEAAAKAQDAPFSLEAFCGAHREQLAFVRDPAHRKLLMAARQSGKTQGDDGALMDAGLFRPNSTNMLIGLTGPAVRNNNWFPIWKRMWDRFGGLEPKWRNESSMSTTFPNGARVLFGGSDDVRHIKNVLGGRVENGVVIVDECQDQGAVLDELLDSILPPMLGMGAQLILSGVIPEVPAGRFWEESGWVERNGIYIQENSRGWSLHNWGRLANVHTPDARAVLDRYLSDTGLTEDHPQIQRDWFGRPCFDPAATAYHYNRARNGYTPALPDWLPQVYASQKDGERPLLFAHPMREDTTDGARYGLMAAVPRDGVDLFSFAIDFGGGDRCSIQGWGWGSKSREVQHVLDWSTPRRQRLTTGQVWAVAALVQRVFTGLAGRYGGVVQWKMDTQTDQEVDTMMADYRIPLVRAAQKADRRGQVNRNNDLLEQGRAAVMIGSALEQDYQRARWDKNALARGVYEWASSWHPDPSEAARYALQDYLDGYVAPVVKPTEGTDAAYQEEMRRALQRKQNTDEGLGFLNETDDD